MQVKTDAKDLAKMFKTIGKLNKEATIMSKDNEISCIVPEAGMAAMISYKLKVEHADEGKMSIDMMKINSIIRRFEGTVTISTTDTSVSLTDGNKTFSLPQIDIKQEDRIPEIDFKCKFGVDNDVLSKIIDDASVSESDSIKFAALQNDLVVTSGEQIKMSQNMPCLPRMVTPDMQTTQVSIELIEYAIGVVEKLDMEFATDLPLKLSGENDKIKFMCIIAPRVTD